MQFNTLTLTLQNFIAAFSAGYGRLQGPLQSLLALLVGIDVVLLGLGVALGGGESVAVLLKKILQIGLWVWLVQSFPTLAKAFVDSLVQAGLLAGGGSGDASLLLDPSRVAGYGLDATQPLAQKLEDLGSYDLADLALFGMAYLTIMGCFVLMAINLFLAVLEYYLFVACAGILLPFGLLAPTRFLAEKAIGAVVSAAIKLMVLAFLTAVLDPVLRGLRFEGPAIALNELWAMLLTLCAMTLLCWKAPSLAAGLLAGSPHLGGADLLAPGAAVTLATRSRIAAARPPAPGPRASAQRPATASASTAADASSRAATADKPAATTAGAPSGADATLVASSTKSPDAEAPTLAAPTSKKT